MSISRSTDAEHPCPPTPAAHGHSLPRPAVHLLCNVFESHNPLYGDEGGKDNFLNGTAEANGALLQPMQAYRCLCTQQWSLAWGFSHSKSFPHTVQHWGTGPCTHHFINVSGFIRLSYLLPSSWCSSAYTSQRWDATISFTFWKHLSFFLLPTNTVPRKLRLIFQIATLTIQTISGSMQVVHWLRAFDYQRVHQVGLTFGLSILLAAMPHWEVDGEALLDAQCRTVVQDPQQPAASTAKCSFSLLGLLTGTVRTTFLIICLSAVWLLWIQCTWSGWSL